MVLIQNWPFFHLFILVTRGQENVFYDILEGKNASLGYEKKKLKKSKNSDFLQRGYPMVLVQNWPFFHLFILGNIGQENVF